MDVVKEYDANTSYAIKGLKIYRIVGDVTTQINSAYINTLPAPLKAELCKVSMGNLKMWINDELDNEPTAADT